MSRLDHTIHFAGTSTSSILSAQRECLPGDADGADGYQMMTGEGLGLELAEGDGVGPFAWLLTCQDTTARKQNAQLLQNKAGNGGQKNDRDGYSEVLAAGDGLRLATGDVDGAALAADKHRLSFQSTLDRDRGGPRA